MDEKNREVRQRGDEGRELDYRKGHRKDNFFFRKQALL
jgi:hypothetical protein